MVGDLDLIDREKLAKEKVPESAHGCTPAARAGEI